MDAGCWTFHWSRLEPEYDSSAVRYSIVVVGLVVDGIDSTGCCGYARHQLGRSPSIMNSLGSL
jgi:hypothetical protein